MLGPHDETFFGADLDAIAADDATVGVKGPRLGLLVDGDGGGWATALAGAAKDAILDPEVQLSPASSHGRFHLHGIKAGNRFTEQATNDIADQSEHGVALAFSATDAGVNREDDDGDVGELAAGEHVQERWQVSERGGAGTEPFQITGAITFNVKN